MTYSLAQSLKRGLLGKALDLLDRGSARTSQLKKNILGSFLLKGISFLISYVRIPLVLGYISVSEYGLWITLSSLVTWCTICDIGLGNSLRNKLAESFAKNDLPLARIYISTAYATITIIMASAYAIFFVIAPFLDWAAILNAPAELSKELFLLAAITFSTFVFQFILNLIVTVLTADQRPAIGSAIGMVGSVLFLLMLFVLKQTTAGSLIYLAIASGSSTLLVLIVSTVYFFCGRYKNIRPSFSFIDFNYFRDLAGLGIQFFLIQIVAIIHFTTDNIIITQLHGPCEVTPYNLARKYMEIVPMVFSMVMYPLWSAYTEAFVKKDYVWIRKSVNTLIKVWIVSGALIILQIVPAKWFFHLWIGNKLQIPIMLLFCTGIYHLVVTWCQIFGFFINGVGKIRLQLYSGIFQAAINIPLAILFGKYMGMGSSGVILGTTICLAISAVWAPIQYYKIINGTAQGIWAK